MGIDQNEARRQRAADKGKRTVHPYAAIEHRVIDSAAYAAKSGRVIRPATK